MSPQARQLIEDMRREADAGTGTVPPEIVDRLVGLPEPAYSEARAYMEAMMHGIETAINEDLTVLSHIEEAERLVREAREPDRAEGRPVNEDMTAHEAFERLQEAGRL